MTENMHHQEQIDPSSMHYKQHNKQMLALLQSLSDPLLSNPKSSRLSKKSNSNLEQQLHILSQSYKSAQQKLLSLEKQLYHESLLNEKQRSIAQILKYIINDNLDDETILTYISSLQQQDQSFNVNTSNDSIGEQKRNKTIRSNIKTELQQIKQMIMRKKHNSKKIEHSKDGVISDLKKQIKICNQVKRQLMEDLQKVIIQKQQFQQKINSLEKELEARKIKNKQQMSNLQKKCQQISSLKDSQQYLRLKLKQQEQTINKNENLIKKFYQKIHTILEKPQHKQNCTSSEYEIQQLLQKICSKVQKYRKTVKKLSHQKLNESKYIQLTSALKLFIPRQAEKIVDEYESNHSQCLLKQIQSIAKLHHRHLAQMEACQQQMWNYKVRSLKSQDSWIKGYNRSISKSHKLEGTQSLKKNTENIDPNIQANCAQFRENN